MSARTPRPRRHSTNRRQSFFFVYAPSALAATWYCDLREFSLFGVLSFPFEASFGIVNGLLDDRKLNFSGSMARCIR